MDSCTKYLNLNRSDLLIHYNLKADSLALKEKNVSFGVNYHIQYNYILAFRSANMQGLRKIHTKRILSLIELERENSNSTEVIYLTNLGQMGSYFVMAQEFDSAKIYYEHSIEVAIELKDPVYIASTQNNMGVFMTQYKNWEAALPFFKSALDGFQIENSQDSILYCSILDNLSLIHI